MMGVGAAVNTQVIFKADSLKCGLWEMPIQNAVRGKRREEDVRMGNTSCRVGRPLALA